MENEKSIFDLDVDPIGKAHLKEAAKWARFLAITGFIGIGLVILFSVISLLTSRPAEEFTNDPAYETGVLAGTIIGSLVMGAVYFFPCLFLFRFASRMRVAIDANDLSNLNESFRNLKITFRYLGIVTIIFLVFLLIGMLAEL